MQADVSLVGWAAPSAVMTERAPSGPSIDAAADDLVLVEAALAGLAGGLRRAGHAPPARCLPVCHRFA